MVLFHFINMNNQDLISLCEKSVVPFQEWHDRDSYIAQSQLYELYIFLKLNIDFTLKVEQDTIWIYIDLNDDVRNKVRQYCGPTLEIDCRDDYFDHFGYESEMFDHYFDLSRDQLSFYLLTKERLEKFLVSFCF